MSTAMSKVASNPALLSLTDVAQAISRRQMSSREVTQSCLDGIQAWQPWINAFLAIDAEAALRAADAADNASARHSDLPLLHGVPLAHKDMFYEEGSVTTCGSLIRKDWKAPSTSTVLARLRQAGAIRLGTLNMAEFAYGPTGHNEHFGPVRNPWRVDRITGGSSSGSGAAVAACLTFAALGSDTGGSVRLPANFCGITGLKTAAGRVSRANAMPLSPTLDTVGPLARTVEDCALILQLIAGPIRSTLRRALTKCPGSSKRRGNRSADAGWGSRETSIPRIWTRKSSGPWKTRSIF
jgi:aspartyl-tRNA(Asn)/glutamyl-tRNA(Gln) amidotransferase subunit A